MNSFARKATDPMFAFVGWVLFKLSLIPCALGAHVGELRELSDGHHSRYCHRCGRVEWVE